MVGQAELIEQRVARAGINALEELPGIAVLIPCFNEESTIACVIKSVRAELPVAQIYVFDNNSTDAQWNARLRSCRHFHEDVKARASMRLDWGGTTASHVQLEHERT